MKTESNVKPEQVIVEKTGAGMCEVVINTNISESITKVAVDGESDSSEIYEYDSYRFELVWRNDIADIITSDLDAWIEYAVKVEATPKELTDKEKIEQLVIANQNLLKDNEALKEDNELLKGCIMELADVLYN